MHRFIPDPQTATSGNIDPSHTEAIKRWTRGYLKLSEDEVVMVSELACADIGCPLVETTIHVFSDQETKTWRLTRPKVAVTKWMIEQTLVSAPAKITPR